MIRRARVLRGADGPAAKPLLAPGASNAQRRRIAREEVEARGEAEQIASAARARAGGIVAAAQAEASRILEVQRASLIEEADAKLTARWLHLRREEQRVREGSAERVIVLASALAERILDASLQLEPERIVALARGVLAEAGGARRAVIEASPLDAAPLRARIADGGFDLESVEVRETEGLARGELRLHTDIGIVDARLAPRFDRLAAALRDVLG